MPERKTQTGRELLEGTGGNKCNFISQGMWEEESHGHPRLPTLPGHEMPAWGTRAASVSGTLMSWHYLLP